MTILSETDLAALNLARTVLQRVERAASLEAWQVEENSQPNAAGLGRVAEAASIANDAIFNVINATNTYGHQKIDKFVLHNGRVENEEAAL